MSHWTGDNTPSDSVGSNHGTLNGDTTYATGKIGDAFSLDGTDDYVNVPDSASLDVAPTTRSMYGLRRMSCPGPTRFSCRAMTM